MRHRLDYNLHEVAGYINWLYFFHAWEFPSHYGIISQIYGCQACRENWLLSFPPDECDRAREAVSLFQEAQAMLRDMDTLFRTHAIVGLFPANSDGDDIVIRIPEGDTLRLPMLRQQRGDQCLCLSDFLLPLSRGERDTVGLFAASVDAGMERSFPTDDFRHMLCQTLADRLAEATAERAHEVVRKRLWGYASDERLTVPQLLAERYQGKRPAVGYPSLPDQSLNFLLSDILGMDTIGITLTQSGAMIPHASVSGMMLAHPKARHFSVGIIGEDQLTDYARRRHLGITEARQFLTANLP